MSEAQTNAHVLISGAAGMLGSQLLLDAPAGTRATGADLRAAPAGSPEVALVGHDLTDAADVERLFDDTERNFGALSGVIHPAAYTAVDKAEEEPAIAHAVNATAAGLVAAAAASRGLRMVLVSTDFVFDGEASVPYGEDAAPTPTSVYGSTKLEGERLATAAHPEGLAIVRTQWLYGPRGNHFPGTMLKLAQDRDQLNVVDDQRGSPTSTLALSPALWDVLGSDATGVFHGACEGQASWYDFARATFEIEGVAINVHPCTTAEFPRPAKRPAFSVLDCSKLARLRGRTLGDWRDILVEFLASESTAGPTPGAS